MCRLLAYNVANLSSKLSFGNFFSYVNSFEIFFLFETHVTSDKRSSFSSFFKDYILYWVDAKKTHSAGRASGGCLYGFRKSIAKLYSIKFVSQNENVFVSIDINGSSCFLIPRYINCTNWKNDFESFENFLCTLTCDSYVILGDLNARIGSEQHIDSNVLANAPLMNNERKFKDTLLNDKGRKCLSLFESMGSFIVNGRMENDKEGEFTFYNALGRSTIDFCVSSFEFAKHILDFSIPSKSFSDHMPLNLVFEIKSSTQVLPLPSKLFWNSNQEQLYKRNLSQLADVDHIHSSVSIDTKLQTVQDKIIRAANAFSKPNKTFNAKMEWYDFQCEEARRKMLKLLNFTRKYDLDIFRTKYIESRTKYFKLCRSKKLEWLQENINKLNYVKDSRDWWKLANSLRKIQPTYGNNLQIEDLRQHFYSLLNNEVLPSSIQWSLPNNNDIFLDAPFEMHEMLLVLKKAKPHKSPGTDRIAYEFYKNAPQEFLEEIIILLNAIFLKEEIPSSFKISLTLPIFKKGDRNDPCNYRGLSLLDTIYKIFMGMLRNRIEIWAENKKIFSEFQAGFRGGYSTIDNLFNLSSIVHIRFKSKLKLYAFFVDFSCAFDKLPRNALFYKLSALGLSKKLITVLMLIYGGTLSQVWDGSSLSTLFEVTQGVRQGCLLSPTLFNMYLADLVDWLPCGVLVAGVRVKVLLYADDIVLLAESPEDLQTMIDSLYDYSVTWGLQVNLEKSKVMIFRQHTRLPSNLAFKYGNTDIEIVNDYKYLGVRLNYNLSFTKHLNDKLLSTKNALMSTWSRYLLNPKISCSNKMKIYSSCLNAILLYGAPIWGFKNYDHLDRFLRFFVKKILFLPNNTPNYMIYLETNLSSPFLPSLAMHFDYIRKIIGMPDNRLPHKLAHECIRLRCSWVAEWDDLASQHGFSPVSEFNCTDIQLFQQNLLVDINKKFKETLTESARASQFHDSYCNLNYDITPYFTDNFSAYQINQIFKARGGLLNINARAFKTNTLGLCTLCNLDAAENTEHFLAICPCCKRIRAFYFGHAVLTHAQYIDILNGNNFHSLYQYLIDATKYRNLIINEFY